MKYEFRVILTRENRRKKFSELSSYRCRTDMNRVIPRIKAVDDAREWEPLFQKDGA